MPDREAAGDPETGAASAPSAEPPAPETDDDHTHERVCLNCGTPLEGEHCHACGQKAHVHRTLKAFWHDLAHSALHFEGKIWRTLPLLAWNPGELTRRYIAGERVRFVSPVALFLFSVFLMFAVFSLSGNAVIGDPTAVGAVVTEEIVATEQTIAGLERDKARTASAGRATAAIDRQLASAREELTALRRVRDQGLSGLGEATAGGPIDADLSDAPATLRYFDEAYRKAKQNPSLLFHKLQTNAYKFSWALIPLSVPFLWLLFLHRRRDRKQFSGYDHFVFVTYSIAAMSLALIGFVLVRLAGISFELLNLLFLAIPPIHVYRQLRGAYGLSRWSAGWRTVVLLWFALVALTLFGLLLVAMGLFG